MAKKNAQKEMSFLNHLEELRWMLVRSTIAILVMAVVSFFFSDFIFNKILFGPKDPNFITYRFFCNLTQYVGLEETDICNTELSFIIQNTDMSGQFSFLIWTCITVGFILAFPVVLWEIWKFIRPALYDNERKYAKAFISVSSLLFFAGVVFGYLVVAPLSIYFFGNFSVSNEILNEINLTSYTGMIKTSVIACGFMFELPILIFFLSKLGLVTPAFLRKYRRHAIVIILFIAAIITPPDVISQIIVSIPILILYEISILISAVIEKKENNKLTEEA
ncbi:MAG: twin-arginine translocase subunit TatC [Flavobacteriaceae bacterium]|jgi:sec-independent protein translocase protein TatC|nr:twin-arginine translocase subunit TatC [Flavobacteriaceae bacterium]